MIAVMTCSDYDCDCCVTHGCLDGFSLEFVDQEERLTLHNIEMFCCERCSLLVLSSRRALPCWDRGHVLGLLATMTASQPVVTVVVEVNCSVYA